MAKAASLSAIIATTESQAAAIAAEPMPCDNCHHKNCENEHVACWDYAHYLEKGDVINKRREPAAHIYQAAMDA